jgi:hypothetical protein
MAESLRVTELDFDTIKQNLKNYLKQQSEFTDYDFEGSGLAVLLDILAYNTHYQAYYLNMVANESFLDTALLRDSVVSHAKTLGYTPNSKKASKAVIDFTVVTNNTDVEQLTIPAGFSFLSNQIDGRSYNFVVLEGKTVTKSDTNFYFENLEIYEGQLTTFRYIYDSTNNPKQIFTINDESVDVTSLKVSVSPSVGSTQVNVYNLVNDVYEIDGNSEVYFLQEGRNGLYQIYFGDDVLGKKLSNGSVVTIQYLITNGVDANKANLFTATRSLEGYNNFIVDTVSTAGGGSNKESVDKIKYLAPIQFVSQNRVVTKKDYEVFIKKSYPNVDSVSIWGGEEEIPPIYGKVFISLKPQEGFFISESEKDRIINEIIDPRSVMTIKTEFRDPDYLYVMLKSNLQYDPNKTTLTQEIIKRTIRNTILLYKNTYLDTFESKLVLSKLEENINDIDINAFVGCDSILRVQKRIRPVFNKSSNYTINFNVPLLSGSLNNKLTSTSFDVFDSNSIKRTVFIEEIPKTSTSINSINVITPGEKYTSIPTVTIIGDGVGATATATVVNGKIQNIKIINPGIDYTRATVVITGGGGFGATATAVIETNIGILRTVYYTPDAERQVVNSNVGSIDYEKGLIQLNNLTIVSTSTNDQLLRIECPTKNNIIQSNKNTIITIDENDPSSITIDLQPL